MFIVLGSPEHDRQNNSESNPLADTHLTVFLYAARSGMSASGKFKIITNEQVFSLVNTTVSTKVVP